MGPMLQIFYAGMAFFVGFSLGKGVRKRSVSMGWLKKFQSENRYVVFFFLYVGFCISYIDRSAIGLALSSISKDFALAPTQMGVVISAFFIGYSIMQIPGGWLADHFGSKTVICIDTLVHLHLHDRPCIDACRTALPALRIRSLRRSVCRFLLQSDC